MSEIVSIATLDAGETGRVAAIRGGFGLVRRLNAFGIYEGKVVTKISTQWMRGPG